MTTTYTKFYNLGKTSDGSIFDFSKKIKRLSDTAMNVAMDAFANGQQDAEIERLTATGVTSVQTAFEAGYSAARAKTRSNYTAVAQSLALDTGTSWLTFSRAYDNGWHKGDNEVNSLDRLGLR